METYPGEVVWPDEQTRGNRKLCKLPCHSCYIFGTCRSKTVGGFKVIVWKEAEVGSHKGGGHFLWGS